MSSGETAYLTLVIVAAIAFVVSLAGVSWWASHR